MKTYLLAFLTAAVASAILTPIVLTTALRNRLVTVPGGRHVHQRSTPRLGGIGIAAAIYTSLIVLWFTEAGAAHVVRDEWHRTLAVAVGGAVMFGVGLLDDIRGVRAQHKLLAQAACATLAFALGFRIDAVQLPWIGTLQMGVFRLPITIFWVAGIINAVNLIDGLDGLAAGVVFFAAVTNFVVAVLSDSTFVGLLMAATVGAVLGFLFYNFNPARIFMGDSGSYFLGFVLAVTSIAAPHQKASATVALLVPIVALGVPIIDTLLAIVRRFLERRPLFSPDRGHIHHRLLDMGITQRRAVLLIYAVCVVMSGAAIAISFGKSWHVGLAILAASGIMFGLIRSIGYLEYLTLVRRQKTRIYGRETERIRRLLSVLPSIMGSPRSDEDVWARFDDIVREGGFGAIELIAVDGRFEECLRRWVAPASHIPQRELVSARYELRRELRGFQSPRGSNLELKFIWRGELGDVSPQMDVLLLVFVDAVQAHLCATDAAQVAAAVDNAEVTSEASVALALEP